MERSADLINFVFEDQKNHLNLTACTHINGSGLPRFCTSPLAVKMINRRIGNSVNQNSLDSEFIVAVGVNNSPEDWAIDGLFRFLPYKIRQCLAHDRALMLIDQSLEGYHDDYVWKYLHKQCSRYNIKASNIIYVTGNLLACGQYELWSKQKNLTEKLHVIPFVNFEDDIYNRSKDLNIDISVEEHLQYKKSNKTKDYNCMQKRPRNHRIWLYHELFKKQILKNGICSMNVFPNEPAILEGKSLQGKTFRECQKKLPLKAYDKPNDKESTGFYINRIQKKLYLDTWATVVSEASFADEDSTIFLSEKLFKPIACRHPFVVFGNKCSLIKLRQMGYKTFTGFIDESYDTLPTFERFDAVINTIEKIIAVKDKAAWFAEMQDILDHNYETLKRNSQTTNPAFKRVIDIYESKFL